MFYNDLYCYDFLGFNFIFSVICILNFVFLWKVFEKAGEEGWKALIPFYNLYILTDLTLGQGWLFLLYFVPIANIVLAIVTYIKLAEAFHKTGWFAVGLIFIYTVFIGILALDDSTYEFPGDNKEVRNFHEEDYMFTAKDVKFEEKSEDEPENKSEEVIENEKIQEDKSEVENKEK